MATEIKDKGVTLERILKAAQREFSSRGFDGASIEQIARAANVTKQLIYHYFDSKDQLYRTTLESVANELQLLVDPEACARLGALDALTLVANRTIDEYLKHPSYAALTLDQGLHHGAHISERSSFIGQTRSLIDKVIQPTLARGIASGELRPNLDAGIVYWLIFHAALGCFHNTEVMSQTTKIDFASPAGIETWRAAVIDLFRSALRQP